MKKILYVLLLLWSFNSFAQELMEHDFDKNISLLVPEDSAEGEQSGLLFVRGSIGEDTFVVSKSEKGSATLSNSDDNGFLKFFQGVRDGSLKSSKGKALKESMIEISGVKTYSFSYSMLIDNKTKTVDQYIFFYKKTIYTLQFVSPEKASESFENTKKKILDSVKMH